MQGENAKKVCGFDKNDLKTYSRRRGLEIQVLLVIRAGVAKNLKIQCTRMKLLTQPTKLVSC